jgi:hypothetical protein
MGAEMKEANHLSRRVVRTQNENSRCANGTALQKLTPRAKAMGPAKRNGPGASPWGEDLDHFYAAWIRGWLQLADGRVGRYRQLRDSLEERF